MKEDKIMMMKIKIFVLVFMLPVFMVACSSDDDTSSSGGPLTLGVSVSGSVVFLDSVLYTLSITAGDTYVIDLDTTSGDADLYVCDLPDCSVYEESSANYDLVPDQVTVDDFQSYNGTLYIHVINAHLNTSSYRIVVN